MISKFSVKRPYTVIVGVILVIVLGVVSFTRMTTDLLPDMNLPYALVITTDVGASPEEVEADVPAQLRVLGQNGTIVLDDLPRLPLAVGNEPRSHALEDGVLDSLRVEALIVEPLRHQHGRRDGGVDGGRKFF